MSDILIKGMEMPKSEEQCKFFQPVPFRAPYCAIDGVCHGIEDCPLVLVPAHGRLIDADKLEDNSITYYAIPVAFINVTGAATKEAELVIRLKDLDSAPTIIPAEEGE